VAANNKKKRWQDEMIAEVPLLGIEPEETTTVIVKEKIKAARELRSLLESAPFIESLKKDKMALIIERFDLNTLIKLKGALIRENLRYLQSKSNERKNK